MYLLLLIAYSDLKEADTDFFLQPVTKNPNRTAEPPAVLTRRNGRSDT